MQPKDRLLTLKSAAEKDVQRLDAELCSGRAKLGAFQESFGALQNGGEGDAAALSVLRRFQEKIKREEACVAGIEKALIEAKARVEGFDEVLRMFPKEGEDSELRAGSQMFDIREALRANRQPMTLTEILKAIGVDGDDKKRNSLRGSLAAYANKGRVFTKEDAPETFGLIEFRTEAATKNGTAHES